MNRDSRPDESIPADLGLSIPTVARMPVDNPKKGLNRAFPSVTLDNHNDEEHHFRAVIKKNRAV